MTVLVRDASRLPPGAESRVTVVQGDVLDPYTVGQAVQGADAVVVVIGTNNDLSELSVLCQLLITILEMTFFHHNILIA